MQLVIVESPAKAKTIATYLGPGYVVRASMGHVRDLPKAGLGVDLENGYTPTYQTLPGKASTLRELSTHARSAEQIVLATDPDREGEAIAWHLVHALRLPATRVRRVEFHSLTRDAVAAAMRQPRAIDQPLVDAQQARRVLDRLVGYGLSPVLWQSVKRGLSAGRVQSVAVRLIVDREREILAFEPREYWTITGQFSRVDGPAQERKPFEARLHRVRGEPVAIATEAEATRLVDWLTPAAYTVTAAETKPQQRRPAPPFTTSTLQQEAARKLNLPTKTTMSLAQQLYEGVAIGGRVEGLITYMRTDSLAIAPAAGEAARRYIAARWDERAVPAKAPTYKARTKGAQEAHEAIRPTDPARDPDQLRGLLSPALLRLYRLIWQRFIASQMSPVLLDVTTVDIAATLPEHPTPAKPAAIFRATGSVLRYPGFLQVYRESRDEAGDDELDQGALPALSVADALRLLALMPQQHFTQPPPRFTEASLVKQLEEAGIGRPSTYASIISTIMEREYVEKVEKQLRPTELGMVVTDLLVAQFGEVMDPHFTAAMEQRLDDVASGERAWVPVIDEFYQPFAKQLAAAKTEVQRVRLPATEIGEACPECQASLVQRAGKFGPFISCSAYPTCTYTRPLVQGTGVACPACRDGELVQRRGKQSGKPFWSCNRYPACTHVEWYLPIPAVCARCGGHLSQITQRSRRCIACDGQPPRRTGPTRAARPAADGPKKPRTAATPTSRARPATGRRRPVGTRARQD